MIGMSILDTVGKCRAAPLAGVYLNSQGRSIEESSALSSSGKRIAGARSGWRWDCFCGLRTTRAFKNLPPAWR